MNSMDSLCNVPQNVNGYVVADGVVHPSDYERGLTSMIHAGRVVRTNAGAEVLSIGGAVRSLPRNWRQLADRQGQRYTRILWDAQTDGTYWHLSDQQQTVLIRARGHYGDNAHVQFSAHGSGKHSVQIFVGDSLVADVNL